MLACCYDAVDLKNCERHRAAVRVIVQHLEAGISYQYQGAWPCVFRLLGQCYSELGLYYAAIMMPSLKALCQLMANSNLVSLAELEKAIGKAVQGLGVEAVVFSAPVQITGNITEDEKNLWVLPLLRKFVRGSRLIFYNDHFVPLAKKCFEIIEKLGQNEKTDPRLIQTYSTIQYQIWALLPSFADEATDVEAAQCHKNFPKLICQVLQHSDGSRLDAMRALRNMVVADGTKTGKLAKNSKNYMPALFNIFTKEPRTALNADDPNAIEDSQRKAAFETIRVYLTIVPDALKNDFMQKILKKYQDEEDELESGRKETGDKKLKGKAKKEQNRKNQKNRYSKSAMLHLARLFVPHVSSTLVNSLVAIVKPLIKSAKDKREQKAAYKVLQDVLSSDSASTEQYINEHLSELSELLLESMSLAATSSRAPRLRCAKVRKLFIILYRIVIDYRFPFYIQKSEIISCEFDELVL